MEALALMLGFRIGKVPTSHMGLPLVASYKSS